MKLYDVIQPSPEWHLLRMVRPTASEFDRIMSPAKRRPSSQMDAYAREILEAIDHEYLPPRAEVYMTRPMRLGLAREPDAARWYAHETGHDLCKIGFMTTDDGRFGCSPDRGVLDRSTGQLVGLLECKCPLLDTHRRYLDAGVCPREYLCQLHGQLIVSGLPWIDFLSYPPPAYSEYEYFPPLIIRVTPDGFTNDLRVCLEMFWLRFLELKKSA